MNEKWAREILKNPDKYDSDRELWQVASGYLQGLKEGKLKFEVMRNLAYDIGQTHEFWTKKNIDHEFQKHLSEEKSK